MRLHIHLLIWVALLYVPAPGQAQNARVDRSTTARKAEDALRADGSRPGDEHLTCEQIGQQMAGLFGQMDKELGALFDAATRANEEVKRSQQALAVRNVTEAPALMAGALAEGALASTNPAAAAAMGRAHAVEDQLAAARAAAGGRKGNATMQETLAASAGLIDEHSDKIPRMNRLTLLFEAKHCAPPEDQEVADEDD